MGWDHAGWKEKDDGGLRSETGKRFGPPHCAGLISSPRTSQTSDIRESSLSSQGSHGARLDAIVAIHKAWLRSPESMLENELDFLERDAFRLRVHRGVRSSQIDVF